MLRDVVHRTGIEPREPLAEPGVSAHNQHRRQRHPLNRDELLGQLDAVHLRHVEVGDEQVRAMFSRELERIPAVASDQHAVVFRQDVGDLTGEPGVILGEHDRRCRMLQARPGQVRGRSLRRPAVASSGSAESVGAAVRCFGSAITAAIG